MHANFFRVSPNKLRLSGRIKLDRVYSLGTFPAQRNCLEKKMKIRLNSDVFMTHFGKKYWEIRNDKWFFQYDIGRCLILQSRKRKNKAYSAPIIIITRRCQINRNIVFFSQCNKRKLFIVVFITKYNNFSFSCGFLLLLLDQQTAEIK